MNGRALVVGAGPAGLGAALQLASWCESVVVIDARPSSRQRRVGEHLPPAALSAFASIGLIELLDDSSHEASSGVCSSWCEDTPAEREYYFSPPGRGINLCRETFDEALALHVESSGVEIRYDSRLIQLDTHAQLYRAAVRSPDGVDNIDADIVVDASGRNARAARQLGARVERVDQLVGIVGQYEQCEIGDDMGRLFIEAARDGWWYGVQFSSGSVICTYMTDISAVQLHPMGARGLWQDRLASSMTMATLTNTGCWSETVDVFDASTQVLDTIKQRTFLAVGDAAAAFDPLSSWGISKGILDGYQGAQAIERTFNNEKDAVIAYRDKQKGMYHHYRIQRARIYDAERRWPESQFWRSRQTELERHWCLGDKTS